MPKKKQASGASGENGTVRLATPLPLSILPNEHPCNDCGHCCTYIAVEIDNPSNFEDYDNIFWYLTHKGVSVYVDFEGDWFIEFETVCEYLSAAKTCGIYESRPHMCSSFSWDECEKTTREPAWKVRFTNSDELFAYIEKKRPRNFERYIRERDKMRSARNEQGAKPEKQQSA